MGFSGTMSRRAGALGALARSAALAFERADREIDAFARTRFEGLAKRARMGGSAAARSLSAAAHASARLVRCGRDGTRRAFLEAQEVVEDRPYAAMGLAVAAGLLAGLVLSRGGRLSIHIASKA